MIKKRGYVIIGSTGKNTGKTEFACSIIKNHSSNFDIYGVKVVAINQHEGSCPQGGDGCGICVSLSDDFEIFEETAFDIAKDTSRMLMAGAKKVYMLKVEKSKLQKGLKALVEIIPPNALVVVESNSIRKVLEPDKFIVIKNLGEKRVKRSCAEVISLADKVIGFQDNSWDFEPERIFVKNGEWNLRQKATAIILAGGKSSRMGGEDKSLLPVNGKPLIQHIAEQLTDYFDEVIIGANDIEKYKFLQKRVIPDLEIGKGPLMGIYSCLMESGSEVNFITACDIPEMNMGVINRMIALSDGSDVVMPVSNRDKHEPLFAVYRKSIAEKVDVILKNNGRKIVEILKHTKYRFVDFESGGWYRNLNFKDDYNNFIERGEAI